MPWSTFPEFQPAPRARGVLSQMPDGLVAHDRWLPPDHLRPWIAHFWWVSWKLESPFQVQTLPHPTVHLVFESGCDAQVEGPGHRRFVRELSGQGRVLGVKFRPAAFSAVYHAPVAHLRGRRVAWCELGTPGFEHLGARKRSVLHEGDAMEALTTARDWLTSWLSELDEETTELRDLVERAETDTTLVQVSQLAQALGCSLRTLQRRFERCVGASPKWVLARYRLIEAGERLKGSAPPSLARLAADLGYFDESHFAHDFKDLIGCTPLEFAKRHRKSA